MRKNKLIALVLLFNVFSLFADDTKSTTPKPYSDDEFPQVLKDIRRFEIITLGSLPFAIMDTNLVFSAIDYANGTSDVTPSPFVTKNYEEAGDFFKDPVVWTSVGISVGIGLTDLIVQIVKRNMKSNKTKKTISNKNITITPIEDDPDAIRIDVDGFEKEEVRE